MGGSDPSIAPRDDFVGNEAAQRMKAAHKALLEMNARRSSARS
jgi:hypothetical protein